MTRRQSFGARLDPLHDAFLRAVLEEPADDAARVAFADWLMERDDPALQARGSFVAVQMELARLPDCPTKEQEPFAFILCRLGCPRCVLRRRERELAGYWEGTSESRHFVRGLLDWNDVCRREWGFLPPEDWRHTFRRGFVEEIALTCEMFLGGPCPHCEGTGNRRVVRVTKTCPFCAGTGRTPGHAEQLFRTQPVLRVTLSDREPVRAWRTDGGGNSGHEPWVWREPGSWPEAHSMPNALNGVIKYDEVPHWHDGNPAFDSREGALAFMSKLCVALGRGRAGLPTLTTLRR